MARADRCERRLRVILCDYLHRPAGLFHAYACKDQMVPVLIGCPLALPLGNGRSVVSQFELGWGGLVSKGAPNHVLRACTCSKTFEFFDSENNFGDADR